MQMVTKQDTETSAGFMIAAQMLPNMQGWRIKKK